MPALGVLIFLSLSSSAMLSVERLSDMSSLSGFSTFSSRLDGTCPAKAEERPAVDHRSDHKTDHYAATRAYTANRSNVIEGVGRTSECFCLVVEFGAGCRAGAGQAAVAVVQAGSIISVSVALLQRKKVGCVCHSPTDGT